LATGELADELTLAGVLVLDSDSNEMVKLAVNFTFICDEDRSRRFNVDECGEAAFCGEWHVDKAQGLHNGQPVYKKVHFGSSSQSPFVRYDYETGRIIRRSFWRMTADGSDSQYICACGNFDPNAHLEKPPKLGWIRWRKQGDGGMHRPQPPSPVPALRY
jgi:hypothetical protein